MRRGRRIALGGVLSGALMAAMAISSPAGASTTTAANHVILGSGSSTTYNMMQALDTLFNDSLGCYMTQPSGTTQTLDFSCASVNGGNQVGQGYTENPVNDVAAEEPALGSSAGIDQVELGGPGVGATATAVVNYARSSRALKSTDQPGLNFVSYATDGVSWLTFPEVNGKGTASAVVKSLTLKDLTGIWNGTYKKWNQIPGYTKTAGDANICVYTAQLSSGTEATWASALITSGTPAELNAYVNSLTSAPAGCKTPAHETYGQSHTIFENEAQDIVKNGDEANAIFFFSYGKYQVVCAKIRTGECDNSLSPTGKKKTTVYLGEIDGVAPTVSSILCSPCAAVFPVTRDLFNVYSNGSNTSPTTGFPAATPATINYVSEIGFLCKTQLNTKAAKVADPSTGVWYHTEIANVISAQGFIPWPLQKHEDQGTIDTPAAAVLHAAGDSTYAPNDPIIGNGTAHNEAISNPPGYCKVFTTDS
ncbi:MAG: hypothetical protein ACLQNG_00560 [Acidimicrobiales bacterium]